MALTTFAGVTQPSVNRMLLGSNSAATTLNAGTFALGAGDRMLIGVAYNSGTASVSSIANTGTGLTWTRIGSIVTGTGNRMEIWQSTANAAPQLSAITVTFSAAVTAASCGLQVINCSGFSGISTASLNAQPSGTDAVVTTPTPAAGNYNLTAIGMIFYTAMGLGFTGRIDTDQPMVPADWAMQANIGITNNTWNATAALSSSPGDNVARTMSVFGNATGSWFTAGILAYGPTIQMDDLTFMLRDDGTQQLLNNPSNTTFPIFDVEDVTGLDDQTVNVNTDNFDGSDGMSVGAKFLTGKTIVVDGTIYSNVLPFDSMILDNFKLASRPSGDVGVPFFHKWPGETLRYILAKPTAFKCDVTRLRVTGQAAYQLQMMTEDARSYNNNPQLLVANTNSGTATAPVFSNTVTSLGSADYFPIIWFQIDSSDISAATGSSTPFIFQAPVWQRIYGGLAYSTGLQIQPDSFMAAGLYGLDLANRQLVQYDPSLGVLNNRSQYLTQRNWFGIVAGMANLIVMSKPTGGSGRVVNSGFQYSYVDAWK